ncbi:MAG: universal stress protein [Candidatus Acidiferrales bacterium]
MKLLLATDGSTFSAAATQAVIADVKREGAEIRAIHVVDTRRVLLSKMNSLDAEVMNAPAQRRSAEALVEAPAEQLRAEGFETATAVVWGDPRSKIIEAAREWRADLIVLGSQGRTGLTGFLMGSVSDAVAHHAPCSVEIVRVSRGEPMPRGLRILFAMDDSECSEAAAIAVIAQVKAEGAEVKLMRVLDSFPLAEAEKFASHGYPMEEYPDFVRARAKLRDAAIGQLLKTTEKFQTHGFKVTQTLVEEGDARNYIVECAERWRADLIVVGSHERNGKQRLLMGSVSEAVSRYAACSVEIVRPSCNDGSPGLHR